MKGFVILVSALLFGAAAGKRFFSGLQDDCAPVYSYENSFRFFPEQAQLIGDIVVDGTRIEVANDFSVQYLANAKVVQNFRANETYILHQCGSPSLKDENLPSNAKIFEIPLTNVALADVTSSSFIAELNVTDRVRFASGFVTDTCLQKVTQRCGKEAFDPGNVFADPKKLRRQNREVDAIFTSAASPHPKTIAFTATSDPAVLKRAEWVKFVALFFNKEVEANDFFERISKTWRRTKARKNSRGPLVAWISHQDYAGDEFYVHFAPFKVEHIAAAGGRPLNKKDLKNTKDVISTSNGFLIEYTKKNRTTAVDALHEILLDVDVVIDETYQANNSAYDIAAFARLFGLKLKGSKFKFVRQRRVFRLDGTVGISTLQSDSLDWFETAVARPDLVIKDLQIAFGTRKHRGHKRIWLRNLSTGEVPVIQTHRQCTSFKGCKAIPAPICPSVLLSCVGTIEYRNTTECLPLDCN